MTVEDVEAMSIEEKVAFIEKSERMAKELGWFTTGMILANMEKEGGNNG